MVLDAEQIDMWDYWDETQPAQEDPRMLSLIDMVTMYATKAGQKISPFVAQSFIYEEYAEFLEATLGTRVEELKELADLVYVIANYCRVMGWDLDEAIRRVHENNMGRMYQPDGSIKRREDGKIIKNHEYPAVYLEDLV